MKPIDVNRSAVILGPDRTHALAQPFRHHNSAGPGSGGYGIVP